MKCGGGLIFNSHSNNLSQYQLTQGPDEIRRPKHLVYLGTLLLLTCQLQKMSVLNQTCKMY